MTSPTPPLPDPGQPPILGYSSPATAPGQVDRTIIKKFREQILALGVLWILLGCLAGTVVVLASGGSRAFGAGLAGEDRLLLGIIAALALFWVVLGVLTCMKQMWAVYVGLVLSYISALGNIIQLRVCALVLLIFVILQAHRVIKWAGQLRAAGFPLTAKP